MKFKSTQGYIASDDLMLAVNAAITLQKPLLIKGEPGTGKTMLAEQVAESLGAPFFQWHIKSTTKLSNILAVVYFSFVKVFLVELKFEVQRYTSYISIGAYKMLHFEVEFKVVKK